jgi:hypothetical protein
MASSQGPAAGEDDDVLGERDVVGTSTALSLHPELGTAQPLLRAHRQ